MRQFALRTLGGLPRTFWYLWAGTLVNRSGSFVLLYLAMYLTSARGLTPSFTGLVMGLYGAGAAIGVTVGGTLADRWGRRATLLTAQAGGATAMLVMGALRHPVAIAAGAMLLGTFSEGSRPAFSAMIVDVVPAADRLRAYTLNYWAINLGFAMASVLAGLTAELSYAMLFVVDAATTMAAALIVFLRVKESRPDATGARRPGADRAAAGSAVAVRSGPDGLRAVLADRVFMSYVGICLLVSLVFMQNQSTLSMAMLHDGIAPSRFGMIMSINGVMIVVGQLFVPALIRGRSATRVLVVAYLLVGTGFGLVAVARTFPFYALTVVIWTMGEMLNSPVNSTMIAELSPEHLRGRYQGVSSLAWQGAACVAPVAGGFVQQHAGNATLWIGCAALAVTAAGLQVLAGSARQRRIAAAQRGPVTPPAAATQASAAPVSGQRQPGTQRAPGCANERVTAPEQDSAPEQVATPG